MTNVDCFVRRNRSCSAQAIPPILTHFSIALSVCLSSACLSPLYPLLKPMDGFTVDAIWQVHLWGPKTYCVRFEANVRTPSQNMQLLIAAKPSVICCHLANTNEELCALTTAIAPFAELLWSFFCNRQCITLHYGF